MFRRIAICFVLVIALMSVRSPRAQSFPVTPHLGLCLPAVNSGGWGPCYNQNSNLLDTDIFSLQHPYVGTWLSSTTYTAAQYVSYNGGIYLSLANGNVNNQPDISAGYWVPFASANGNATSILGTSISGSAPASNNQVLQFTSGGGLRFGQLTLDQIAPAFAISSFSCNTAGTYETGATVASPTTCSAAYTSTPSSASLSDGVNSAVTLSTPFTSGTESHSYTCNATITFTLTAVAATTKTATQTIGCAPRTFAGVGTAGATGATASGTSAVLTGATGTLASAPQNNGLGNTYVGQSFSLSPSNQKLYLLVTGSGHTFSVNGFATTFTCTAITFTNVNTSPISMQACESPALLTGNYSVVVTN